MEIAKHSRRGITRSDVVVIVVVAALVLIVALPTLNRWRGAGRRTACQENQRRLAQAALRYESSYGRFPGYRNRQAVRADGERQPTGWIFPLLPYLAAAPKAQGAGAKSTSEPPPVDPNDPHARVFTAYGAQGPDETRGVVPRVFLANPVCPSDSDEHVDQRSTSTSYVANTGMPDERRKGLGLKEDQLDGVFFDRFAGGEVPEVSIAILEQRNRPGRRRLSFRPPFKPPSRRRQRHVLRRPWRVSRRADRPHRLLPPDVARRRLDPVGYASA